MTENNRKKNMRWKKEHQAQYAQYRRYAMETRYAMQTSINCVEMRVCVWGFNPCVSLLLRLR